MTFKTIPVNELKECDILASAACDADYATAEKTSWTSPLKDDPFGIVLNTKIVTMRHIGTTLLFIRLLQHTEKSILPSASIGNVRGVSGTGGGTRQFPFAYVSSLPHARRLQPFHLIAKGVFVAYTDMTALYEFSFNTEAYNAGRWCFDLIEEL